MARVAILLLLALPAVFGDCYMQCPRGSNNRLNEASRDRDNGNRMFDSQNNNRGGVNAGTYGRPYYYVGSVLPIDWTNQHSCGQGNNINCEIIIQYYCDANLTRDGMTTSRIPDPDRLTSDELYTQCLGGDCDNDYRYGRHESLASYRHCKYRSRNRGLWTSSQDMRGNRRGAIFTRQNNNGNRRGYECPEERDYYPYWHPSIWRDLAILTDDYQTRCPAYLAESQNVKGRSYCAVTDEWITQQKMQNNQDPNLGQDDYYGFIPITELECGNKGGVWTAVPSHGIPAPYCGPTPWTRDNHLGFHAGEAHFAGWNWTVTDWMVQESCVLRIRYNMSSAETRWGGEWMDDNSVADGRLNSTLNADYNIQIPQGLQVEGNDDDVFNFRYAAKLNLWEKYGLSYNDHRSNFDANLFQNNVPTRGYVMSNNPVVDIFGPNMGLNGRIRLRLSVNTNQFSRTFQDRSHVFAIRPRPQVLNQPDIRIHNLLVRGKRGNIVQTYPSTEYNFVPDTLVIEKGDFIHFQWTGSNTNPNNNAGQGTQGTDRSNVILLRSSPPGYPNIVPAPGQIGDWKQSYPQRIDDTSPWGQFAGLGLEQKRALARAGIYTPHVDIGPLQVREEGVYNYLCTRNNNFSNRDQKAEIHVIPRAAGRTPYAVIETGSFSNQIAPSGRAWIRFAPDPLAFTTGSQITIEEDGDLIIIRPFFFDIVPGQQIFLEMKYTEGALTQYYIMQSFSPNMDPSFELGTEWDGGIASASINRGGYYKLDARPNIGAIVGIVIGVAALGALIGGGYWQLKRKFKFGAKKKAGLMSDEGTTNTI